MPRKKSAKGPAPVPVPSENTENESNFTFEEEIAWCTKKLQHLLATKYKDTKDIKAVKPIVIALKTLENKNNPLPKMRMVMRNGCGDYRKEMKEEFEKSKSETKQVDFEEVKELKGIKISVKSKETDKTDVSVKSKEADKSDVSVKSKETDKTDVSVKSKEIDEADISEKNSASPFTFNFPPPAQE